LSLENINQGLLETSQKFDVDFSEFTIYADEEKQNHCWYLATSMMIENTNEVLNFLDDILRKNNDDYNSARKYSLKEPVLIIVSPDVFYKYMEQQKKLGSQNKMPRVLNKEQSKTWLKFINAF
jgi:hypothetical protein